MSERLSVLYQGKPICAFELVDVKGQYIEEIRHDIREASQAGKLMCPDCGQRMTLCAGAVMQPYFRHFKRQECLKTMELQTKAGKRKYFCRKALYQIVKSAGLSNVSVCEEPEMQLVPILFECQAGTIGYVYLDGKTRNFKELREKNLFYQKQNIRLFFFLNHEYKSNARNITSDEAECARLNGGEIFYLNLKDNTIVLRKKYRNCNDEICYYEESFDLDTIIPDVDGKITGLFLEHFQVFEKEEKQKFKKVKRIPAEEGVSEEFQGMDYLLMDSLGEIWILPRFIYRIEKDEEAIEQRHAFLEEQNLIMLDIEESGREWYAWQVADYVSKHLNSWDWIHMEKDANKFV